VWYPYYVNWITAILVEITLSVVTIIIRKPEDTFDWVWISIQFVRICSLITLLCLYFILKSDRHDVEIRQSLLTSQDAIEYGTIRGLSDNSGAEQDEALAVKRKVTNGFGVSTCII
jgi:hypothetical protein